jgi:hypothetical protein
MSHFLRRGGVLASGLALVALTLAANQTGGTQTVDAGGVTFQAPASWQKVQPKSAMRKAQLNVPPTAGDTEPAELVVFVFPGGAGTVDQNVERWRQQFRDASGQAPQVARSAAKGKDVDVTRVEVAGTYTDPFAGRGAQPNYHLLGAIVELPNASYFLKMVGPEKTVAAAKADFDKLIASIAKGGS